MALLDFQLPLDQPEGRRRLLERLKNQFNSGEFSRLRLVVAFVKAGPLQRFIEEIDSWAESNYSIEAIFGIDHQNTSAEALAFALDHFEEVRIVHQDDRSVTFHPKVYLFEGDNQAYAYIGSNNLTVSGTESNFEAGVAVSMNLADGNDLALYEDLNQGLDATRDVSFPLTEGDLDNLIERGKVLYERQMWASSTRDRDSGGDEEHGEESDGDSSQLDFPQVDVEPVSSIPSGSDGSAPIIGGSHSGPAVSTLIMEVRQRDNGEIHLSRTAVKRNESFFEFPFSGSTTPKKSSNPSYPQRDPKPVVDVRLYDENGDLIEHKQDFRLTMVDYEPRGEIRITMPREVVDHAVGFDGPDYCILVMKKMIPQSPNEYDISLYIPGSSEHKEYLKMCDTDMPSGGKPNPRSYGWI